MKQNRIQKAAAEAIAAHEAARAAYLIAAKANPWPESPDAPESEWDAHDERDEAIRASFNLDALADARFEAELELIRWSVRVMLAEHPDKVTDELKEASEKVLRYPDLRRKLVASALRLEARS